MMRCPSCAGEASESSRYCPSCGASLLPSSETPTRTALRPGTPDSGPVYGTRSRRSASPGGAWLSTSDSFGESRFIPGTILGGRYRVVGLLGKGGMGEVYRADDLKLGQPVALKLLPEALEKDRVRLARFFNEVRTARLVTHPNVCRVYDVDEVEGRHILSMEYVDGEDLASLLRRIGRLPQDKAIQMARQICAGLAAAHGEGILHRDLKPANIMVDSRGRARITDFGLAGLSEEIAPTDLRAGTPAYMAPEQLAGADASIKTDLYSLGLVLYELFTGRAAFKASSRTDASQALQEPLPVSPSSLVQGIDPAVERVILRCLEKDPGQRPASALAVAAALPGGDPLAAALRAGETPSPEMVADAGDVGGLHPLAGLGCVAGIVVGLVGLGFLSHIEQLPRRVPLDKPPEALAVEARELVRELGYETPPADSVYGFSYDIDHLRHVEQADLSSERWSTLGTVRPSPVSFWYRQGPRNLVPANHTGWVTFSDPPPLMSGLVDVLLDPQGRLLHFRAVPPQVDEPMESFPDPDWPVLFRMAGLEPDRFSPVPSVWNPLIDCDNRAAWEGAYPGQDEIPIRVEACAYRGRPASFTIVSPGRGPRECSPSSRA